MICPNCQKEIPDTARACGYCGYWLGGEKPGSSKPDTSQPALRNPPWLWIGLAAVVVALIGVIIYLFSNNSGQIDTEATVAAAIAATRQAEAVQPIDTPTEKPNDTTTSEPPTATSTPKPTNTPRPTPMPTATIDADPLVYDNFNNPEFDGKWNRKLWQLWPSAPIYEVAQQDGTLMVAQQKGAEKNTEVVAQQYLDFPLKSPTFFEAKLKLDPDKPNGNVHLHLNVTLSDEKGWFSQCTIYGDGDQSGANCWDTAWPQQEKHDYSSESKPVVLGTWHTFRIEVDPATMRFTYYVNGQEVGSHVPVDAEVLKKAKFTLIVGVWAPSADSLTGYIDDVRVGPVER